MIFNFCCFCFLVEGAGEFFSPYSSQQQASSLCLASHSCEAVLAPMMEDRIKRKRRKGTERVCLVSITIASLTITHDSKSSTPPKRRLADKFLNRKQKKGGNAASPAYSALQSKLRREQKASIFDNKKKQQLRAMLGQTNPFDWTHEFERQAGRERTMKEGKSDKSDGGSPSKGSVRSSASASTSKLSKGPPFLPRGRYIPSLDIYLPSAAYFTLRTDGPGKKGEKSVSTQPFVVLSDSIIWEPTNSSLSFDGGAFVTPKYAQQQSHFFPSSSSFPSNRTPTTISPTSSSAAASPTSKFSPPQIQTTEQPSLRLASTAYATLHSNEITENRTLHLCLHHFPTSDIIAEYVAHYTRVCFALFCFVYVVVVSFHKKRN